MSTQEIQTQKEKQVKILAIIRGVCGQLNDLPFGHGMRSYANLDTRKGIFDTEKKFPRAYLYPVLISTEISNWGKAVNEYSCSMDFLTTCKIDDPQEVLESSLYEMFILSEEFITKLANHEGVIRKSMTSIERQPNYHIYDRNLCGYGLTFNIKVNEDYQIC